VYIQYKQWDTFVGWNKCMDLVKCNIFKYCNSIGNKAYDNVFTNHAYYPIK